MTRQQLSDLSEAAALRRYLTMRQAWAPCWGRRHSAEARTRPGERRPRAPRSVEADRG